MHSKISDWFFSPIKLLKTASHPNCCCSNFKKDLKTHYSSYIIIITGCCRFTAGYRTSLTCLYCWLLTSQVILNWLLALHSVGIKTEAAFSVCRTNYQWIWGASKLWPPPKAGSFCFQLTFNVVIFMSLFVFRVWLHFFVSKILLKAEIHNFLHNQYIAMIIKHLLSWLWIHLMLWKCD